MAKQPGDIRRRFIPSDEVAERAKFLREWVKGFDARDGIDLRKPLTRAQRRRIHSTYKKLREITPGEDSQQRWIVKEVRTERTSRLYQDFAKLPARIKGLKRVPITTSTARELSIAEPEFTIDYRANKGRGAVRQKIGYARVTFVEFDKQKLLRGDENYLAELAAQVPEGAFGTFVMGGREAVSFPSFADGESMLDLLWELIARYAPVPADTAKILRGKLKPTKARKFDPSQREKHPRQSMSDPWTKWLEGFRVYNIPERDRARAAAEAKAELAKRDAEQRKKRGYISARDARRKRLKGR